MNGWIKLFQLKSHFRHAKGHQTKNSPYKQLDCWWQRSEDVNLPATWFLHKCMAGFSILQKNQVYTLLHLKKVVLAQDGTKFSSIFRKSLYYANQYDGSCTLAFLENKDNTPIVQKRIMCEYSWLIVKKSSPAQQYLNTKLLSPCYYIIQKVLTKKILIVSLLFWF